MGNRRYLVLVLLAVMVPALTSPASAAVDDLLMKGRVLMLGDSITHAGQYVSYLSQRLARHHGRLPDIIAIGLGSETASGLSEKDHPFPRPCVHERLARALERIKPQVVLACYGMNDGIYWPLDDSRMQAFQQGIGKLIADCRAAGAQVVLLTPPPFDPQPVGARLRAAGAEDYGYKAPFAGYDGVLAAFATWEISQRSDQVRVIDFNGPLTAFVAERRKSEPTFAFSGDGIHPNEQGMLLMADVMLRDLGYPGVGADLAAALATLAADPLHASIKSWREQRSNGWRDYVGYTRDKAVTRATIDDVELKVTALRQTIEASLQQQAP